ncbi:MAG: hypothetical protein CVV22_04540 [Ignavibacteriae bacterium HGW-Ignavibacteriae-1]|jgi:hypothetical protein|nr:MAG: hypothetical protein CVV22_04540 [Ignavibacteriae bacterium HGW-Ignavibacteriae-1]
MIIFGSSATIISTESILDKCTNCGTHNSIQMNILQKYAHVFWIPVFPIGKTSVTECLNCKQVLQKKEFDWQLNEKYITLKSNSRTPIWTFSGLVVFSALIFWFLFSLNQNKAENAQLILTPQKGDIYEIKIAQKQFTLFKVEHVVGDTVYFLVHQYETDRFRGISELKIKENDAYGEDLLLLIKNDLIIMLEKGEIIDIDRD